jgi:hypothetical protein
MQEERQLPQNVLDFIDRTNRIAEKNRRIFYTNKVNMQEEPLPAPIQAASPESTTAPQSKDNQDAVVRS